MALLTKPVCASGVAGPCVNSITSVRPPALLATKYTGSVQRLTVVRLPATLETAVARAAASTRVFMSRFPQSWVDCSSKSKTRMRRMWHRAGVPGELARLYSYAMLLHAWPTTVHDQACAKA
jgi:hypothetical protein